MANTTIYPYGTDGQLPSSIGIINDLTTGGADKALSAEMGKELKQLIDAIGGGGSVNIADEISDTILASASARMVKEIYLNLQKLFDTVNGLANIAFVGTRPTWQTVPIPTHTITLGTMSNVSASMNGTAISGSEDATEGEVTISLTPAQDMMILTENISIKLGTEDVPFTTATDNGSTLVTFILAGDVTISASASSGIGVQVNGNNVSANVNGIALSGDNRTIILSHPNHFEWDGSIGLSVNSVALVENTDYTLVSNQDGTKTITVLKTFTSDAYPIVITASVVEDAHAILDLTNVGSGVTVNKEDSEHVYEGDTINILPASGNKVSASATVGSTSVTLTGDTYAGYTYTIGSGDVSSGGTSIAIEATATELQQFSVTLPSDTRIDMTNDATSILEGSSYTNVLSLNSTAGADDTLYSVGATMAGGGSISTNNNTIHTDCVTGNITINASVGEVIIPAKVHSYSFPAITDNSGECLDDAENNFNLYLYNDSTKSTFGGGYTNQSNIRTNTYSNGKGDVYRLGKAGDGDRVIKVPEFGDFTLVIKNVHPVYEGSPAKVNNNNQRTIWFVDRTDVTYQATNWPSSNPEQRTGQFRLNFRHTQGYYLVASGNFSIELVYCNNTPEKVSVTLYGSGQGMPFPESTIEKDGETMFAHTYTFVITFNAATLKVCSWLVDTDNSAETTTFKSCKEITIDTPLRLPFISVPNAPNQIGGLDVYNYTMDETAIATELNATLNT